MKYLYRRYRKMNKTSIIIRREYLTRVRKKSFLVMTVLGPILLCALWATPFLISKTTQKTDNIIVVDTNAIVADSNIIVVDNAADKKKGEKVYLFKGNFKNKENIKFEYMDDISQAQALLKEGSCDGVLEIVKTGDNPPIKGFMYYGESEPGLSTQEEIKKQMSDIFKTKILEYDYNMDKKEIEWINNAEIDFYTKNILTGKESYQEIKMVLGGVSGFLIYFFVFIFGAQVMKSVSEEKVNRIVEVLVSSVKPVQLLMGKLIGIALVGLTQFCLWVVLTFAILGFVRAAAPQMFQPVQQEEITVNERIISVDKINATEAGDTTNELIQGLLSIDYLTMIGMFLFYFIAGYFLYASLFGAVGSLIDADTDGQQFTLPITVPLIIAIVCLPAVLDNPTGNVAFWLSIIPFTSPVVMMVRIPFGVTFWELALSASVMLLFIAAAVWLAAKIYRTGILMYGKEINYREIWKWLKYKN